MIRNEILERFILGYGLEVPDEGRGRPVNFSELWRIAKEKCGDCAADEVLDALFNMQRKDVELVKFVQRGTQYLPVSFESFRPKPNWKEFFYGDPFRIKVLPAGRVRFQQLSEPNMAEADLKFARLAIEEASRSVAEPDGRPHPKVGAVVVKDGKVISKAHRGESPKCHAEYIALEEKLADGLVAGATVYTTLEPCTTRNHPKIPCAKRLVERKVARVVIGMLDPNPVIRGKGDELLSEAGIEVQLFPRELRAQVEELNREFIRWHKQQQSGGGELSTSMKIVEKQSPVTDPKIEMICSSKGKIVTVFNRQKYGHGYLEGYWGNGAIIVDCNALWVTLQDPSTKDSQTFPLNQVTVTFDNQHNRLQLQIER